MNPPSFGIAIPCHNEAQNIERLLETVSSAWIPPVTPKRILVVSSASTDGTDAIVKEFALHSSIPVKLISEPERHGKSTAVNQIITHFDDTAVIIMISADVIPEEGCLLQLLKAFDETIVGVAGGRPVPEITPQNLASRITQLLWELHHFIALDSPKTTEITAFRNIHQRIDPTSLVDEAELEALLTTHGYSVRYIPSAIIHIKAPLTIADYVRQRVRVTIGHMLLARNTRYRMATLRLDKRFKALFTLWKNKQTSIATIILAALIETWVYLSAFIHIKCGAYPKGIWRVITSAKRPF